jgi:hypothetical protein
MNIRVPLLIMIVLFPLLAFSTEKTVLSHNDVLLNSCQELKTNPNQERGQLCRFYIKGIIDSSDIRSDKLRKSKPLLKEGAWSLFEKRAYRTRVGNREVKNTAQRFCIPKEVSETSVIETVIQRHSFLAKTTNLAATIRVALNFEYPCE